MNLCVDTVSSQGLKVKGKLIQISLALALCAWQRQLEQVPRGS